MSVYLLETSTNGATIREEVNADSLIGSLAYSSLALNPFEGAVKDSVPAELKVTDRVTKETLTLVYNLG